jgi:hypothetical protein
MQTLQRITFSVPSYSNKGDSEYRRLFIRFRSANLYVRILDNDTNNLLGK